MKNIKAILTLAYDTILVETYKKPESLLRLRELETEDRLFDDKSLHELRQNKYFQMKYSEKDLHAVDNRQFVES